MMLLTRLVLVFTAVVLVVNGEEVETPAAVQDDVAPIAATTNDRQRIGKDGNNADHRQGRMALHTEAPSSKLKREQALRSILAARRRQLLGPRSSAMPRSLHPSRTPRPVLAVSKDPLDMLEAQETRHGVYVTAPIGEEVAIIMDNDEEDSAKIISQEDLAKSSLKIEGLDKPPRNSLLIRINDTNSWLSSSKINDTSAKNSSSTRPQKTLEHDVRRKNTVAMPESLYNHFRPVESNIPVEDMTQFLYFGQKIQPESQNNSGSTNNSLLDTTSTSATVPSSRRRYSMKRFSTTTPIPMPRLEEIVNEEMNIALERSTIERNKIPKTKTVFRSPGSGTYFRKSPSIRPSDPTIVSNVILTRESSRNATVVSDNKRENVLLRNSGQFNTDPSAHAHQVVIVEDEGSSAESAAETAPTAHRVGNATTGNAADLTQLHKDTVITGNKEKRHQRKDHSAFENKRQNSTSNSVKLDSQASPSSKQSSTSVYEKSDEKFNKITTWQTVHSNDESTTISSKINPDEDSMMTSSTINDLVGTLLPKSSSMIPTATSPSHSSSLRIVVTEPMLYETGIESVRDEEEGQVEDAVKEFGTVNREHSRETGNPSSLSFTNISSTTNKPIESTLSSSITPKQSDSPAKIPEMTKTETKQQHAYAYEITNVTRLLRNYTGPGLNAVVEQSENGRKKESTVEANVDERMRNTSNKKHKKILEQDQTDERGKEEEEEEEGPAMRWTNVGSIGEIRNVGGSGEPTPQQQPLPLLLPTLQRSSSSSGGIVEPARTPGELSAGTNVVEATASSTSGFNTSTGSTPIITSAGNGGSGNSGASGTSLSGSSSQTPSSSSASSSSSHLVGERGRKGAVGARQPYHQQNQYRGSGGIGIGSRNTSPSATTPVTTTEVSGASTAGVDDYATSLSHKNRKNDEVTENVLSTSTIRWNHKGINKVGGSSADRSETFVNDRRYLRKSVSAVLNQRTVEDGLVKESKRKRGSIGSSSFSGTSPNNRRIKNSRNSASEESRLLASRSMANRTATTEKSEVVSRKSVDLNEDAIVIGVSDKYNKSSDTMTEKQAGSTVGSLESANQTDSSRVTMENVQETTIGTTVAPPTTLESPEMRLTEEPNVRAEKVQTSVEDSNVTSSPATFTSERTDEKTTESLLTSTTTISQTSTTSNPVTSTKSVEITTTPGPPAFPVTPRMLIDPSLSVNKDEVTEINPESLDETNRNKTQESNGVSTKDLDPSEIQKMYRSQTTLKPETVMTTIPPEVERPTDYPVTQSTAKEQTRTMNPVNSSITRKPAGTERSPEVRGRNLSDKSKDKDDILPIMKLYNETEIFNGTGKDYQEAVTTVRTTVLPGAIEVNSTRRQNDAEVAGATTFEPETSESLAKEENGEERQTGNKNRDGNTGIPKKNRHGGGREETHDNAGPPRWSNHSNPGNSYNAGGAQVNRTRHRPGYNHTVPPEFVGYRPEFNGSFFEPGMISVSPRESINISEVITKRHDGDTIATQETVAVVAYILATLVVFPIAVGVGLILRRLIIRNRKVLEESDTSSEISCRKDALNLENGDFKTSIEKAITKLPRIQHLCHEAEKPPPPPSQESRWEFPRDKLRLQTVLGQGNFGQVWKAEADDLTGHQGTTRLVAVKTVKEGASAREKEDLVRELEIMQQLGNHPNVVTLLGCCTEEEPHYLILEYVMYGKLLAYLRDHRTRQDFYNFSEDSAALTSRDLTVFGYCVARGMEYLASKKIIHRDLAARNVLVDHNKLCKIADFGMSRFANEDGEVIEARHGRNALPIRWMAPESLIYSLFTTKTDVWSFGILMWEIVTLGSTPYPDMAAREVMRNVQSGYRLERPSHCRSELFRVIARCWHADPDRRPEFQTLRRDMAQLLEDSMNGHYVDLESFASECTD